MSSLKRTLDKFLNTVTDEPVLHGYTRSSDAASNSLRHQLVRPIELDL